MKTTRICLSIAFLAAVAGTGCSIINDVDSYSSGGGATKADASVDASKDSSHDSEAGCDCPDDGNKCTKEVCENGVCTHVAIADTNPCTDGLCYKGSCCVGCWDGTTCQAGDATSSCGSGGAACANCDDKNECTQDTCEQKACNSAKLNGDKCSAGVCVTGTCECGKDGEPCCSNQVCEGTLVCKSGTCGVCGAAGQSCCSGLKCAAGNTCDIQSGSCVACGAADEPCCDGSCQSGAMCVTGKCQACGDVGQSCCSTGKKCASDSSVCDNQNLCQLCGGTQQLCCTSDTCNTNNYCNSNKCASCGTSGQVCCPAPAESCDSKSVCLSNSCVSCGGQNQPCCSNSSCGSADLVCSSGNCKSCGAKGQPCCTGNVCSGTSIVCDSTSSCVECGLDGEVCCPTGNACAAGASCNSNKCLSCIQQIDSGDNHVCVRKTDGTVSCWGSDDKGQLGYTISSSPLASSVPKTVPGLPLPAISISAGGYHTCAILNDDSLWCWGMNDFGQIGTGTTSTSPVAPTKVTALDAVSAVTVGWYHTCAIRKSDKQAYCWGENVGPTSGTYQGQFWQLGMGTDTANYPTPTAVPAMTDIVSISAGSRNTCFVKSTGAAYCTGYNGDGEIGDGTTTLAKSPVAVAPSISGFALSSVSAGGTHVCGISKDGATTYCWGGNTRSQIGNGTVTSPVLTPYAVQINSANAKFVQLAAGVFGTCAKTDTNVLYCWGRGDSGQAGNGLTTVAAVMSPTAVSILGSAVPSLVTLGQSHACVYRADRSVACFGKNHLGQLGDGGPIVTTATAVTAPILPFSACNP